MWTRPAVINVRPHPFCGYFNFPSISDSTEPGNQGQRGEEAFLWIIGAGIENFWDSPGISRKLRIGWNFGRDFHREKSHLSSLKAPSTGSSPGLQQHHFPVCAIRRAAKRTSTILEEMIHGTDRGRRIFSSRRAWRAQSEEDQQRHNFRRTQKKIWLFCAKGGRIRWSKL